MSKTYFIYIILTYLGCYPVTYTLSASDVQKRTISTVMNEAMKGSASLHRKVSLGQASDAEAQALLGYFKSLAAASPPKGESAEWKARTSRLTEAAQAVVDGKLNAIVELQTAGNCKACHSAHRDDQ